MPQTMMQRTVSQLRQVSLSRRPNLSALLIGSIIITQIATLLVRDCRANPLISSAASVSTDPTHLRLIQTTDGSKSVEAENRTFAPVVALSSSSIPASKASAIEADLSKTATSTELSQVEESYTIFSDSSQSIGGGEQLELKAPSDENALDQTNLSGQYHASKYRRLAAPSAADWWTKLSHKSKSSTKGSQSDTKVSSSEKSPKRPTEAEVATKRGSREGGPTPADGPYREQPISQNAILTIRNQLSAIKGKQRILMTRSVRQLQQLDQKLTDSYKLCLKKKMPLYAGMLYRTRDYVVRMANDVKHEKKVLDAMTKQVNTVLKQRMQNRTLVKEYNKLLGKSSDTKESKVNLYEVPSAPVESQNVRVVTTKIVQQRLKKEIPMSKTSSELQQELQEIQSDNEKGVETTTQAELPPSKRIEGRKSGAARKGESQIEVPNELPTTKARADTKAKQTTRYIVHVNEVNLKKELGKIQSLIDRVNSSSTELSSVVDDIVYLFKLNTKATKKGQALAGRAALSDKMYNQMQEMDQTAGMMMERKRAKQMMFKSPAKLLFEKYARLSSSTRPSGNSTAAATDITTYSSTSTIEMKPLFDASMIAYSESTDAEIGFDYATVVNE